MYDTNSQCLIGRLNDLIAAQRPYTDPERKVQVKKPSKSAIGEHIDKLLKRQITHTVETVSADCAGLSHLGHLVSPEAKALTAMRNLLSGTSKKSHFSQREPVSLSCARIQIVPPRS